MAEEVKDVYNTVLGLTQYGMARSAEGGEVRRVVEQIFCELEVTDARDTLYASCSVMLGEKPERRGSNRRSVKEAEINDIVEGLYKLDGKKDTPRFVTDVIGLARFPEFLSAMNIGTGGNKMVLLEKRLNELTKAVKTNSTYNFH